MVMLGNNRQLFVVQAEEHRLGRRGLLSRWRVVLVLVPLLPGPGNLLAAPSTPAMVDSLKLFSEFTHKKGATLREDGLLLL